MEKLLFGEVSCLRSRSKKKKIGSHAIIIIVVVVASFFSLVAFDCFPLALSPIRSVRRRLRLECACRGQRERNKKPRRARSLAREKLAASSSSGRRNKEQAPRSPSPQFHLSRSLFQAPNKGVPFLIRLASTRYLHSRPVVADHAQLAQPARARVAFLVMKMRRRRLAVRLGDRGHRRRAPADGGGRRRGAGGLGDGGRRRGHRAVRSAGEGREEPPGEEGGGGRGHGCKKKEKKSGAETEWSQRSNEPHSRSLPCFCKALTPFSLPFHRRPPPQAPHFSFLLHSGLAPARFLSLPLRVR